MIDNSDKIGCFNVTIIAQKNQVNCFQCPTLEDATLEANRIAKERKANGLPTDRAYARMLLSRGSRKKVGARYKVTPRELGPEIVLPLDQ